MEDYVKVTQSKWDYFYLSDICEAMTREKADELFEMCAKKADTGARMVLMNNLVERKPHPSSGWRLMEDLSKELWENRRTSFYGFIGVYERV